MPENHDSILEEFQAYVENESLQMQGHASRLALDAYKSLALWVLTQSLDRMKRPYFPWWHGVPMQKEKILKHKASTSNEFRWDYAYNRCYPSVLWEEYQLVHTSLLIID